MVLSSNTSIGNTNSNWIDEFVGGFSKTPETRKEPEKSFCSHSRVFPTIFWDVPNTLFAKPSEITTAFLSDRTLPTFPWMRG